MSLSCSQLDGCADIAGRLCSLLAEFVSCSAVDDCFEAHRRYACLVLSLAELGKLDSELDRLRQRLKEFYPGLVWRFKGYDRDSLVDENEFTAALDLASGNPRAHFEICDLRFGCAYEAALHMPRLLVESVAKACVGNPAWSLCPKLLRSDEEVFDIIIHGEEKMKPIPNKAITDDDVLAGFEAALDATTRTNMSDPMEIYWRVSRDVDFLRSLNAVPKSNATTKRKQQATRVGDGCRLRVDGKTIYLDDEPVDIDQERAAYLGALLKARRGVYVSKQSIIDSSSLLSHHSVTHLNRDVRDKLPASVHQLVEAKHGSGNRLSEDAWIN